MIYASSEPSEEYVSVAKRSVDPERLKRLGGWRVQNDTAVEMISEIGGLPLPRVRFTGRDPDGQGARYVSVDRVLVFSPQPSVLTVVHELAHHEHQMARGYPIKGKAQHGWNFVGHLDRLAAEAELWLAERNGHANE